MKEQDKYGIAQLPESLGQALSLMSKSELVKKVLGDHTFENFLGLKRREWEAYQMQVTKWELENYLPIL
jgi:glutamine synthetase